MLVVAVMAYRLGCECSVISFYMLYCGGFETECRVFFWVSLCSLFREISIIKPISTNVTAAITITSRNQYTSYESSYLALTTFKRWFAKLQQLYSPVPEGTVGSVLRLMFPEEDGRRKYGLREGGFARILERCLGLGEGVLGGGLGNECCNGDSDGDGGCSPGCREEGSGWLGLDVERALEGKCQSVYFHLYVYSRFVWLTWIH